MAMRIQHLSEVEFRALLRATDNPLWRLMWLVGFWHGLRVSELINIKGIHIRDGYVDVKRLKGSEHTIQPYMAHTDPELDESKGLAELAKKLAPEDRLFPITRNWVLKLMKRYGIAAGIPEHKLHPHALKHTIAKAMINTSGIQNVKKLLGHASLGSTGHYLVVTDEEASRAALAGAFK